MFRSVSRFSREGISRWRVKWSVGIKSSKNLQVSGAEQGSARCSKIHELSDRVRLSGVCSVKLALAHRIAPMERRRPRCQQTRVLIDRTYKSCFRFLRVTGTNQRSPIFSPCIRERRYFHANPSLTCTLFSFLSFCIAILVRSSLFASLSSFPDCRLGIRTFFVDWYGHVDGLSGNWIFVRFLAEDRLVHIRFLHDEYCLWSRRFWINTSYF